MSEIQDRNLLVDQLRLRMQEELEQWAKEKEILLPGETLYFTLQVATRDSQEPPRVKHVKKGVQVHMSEFRELTEEDWQKIFSADLPPWQVRPLRKLYKRGNKSLSSREFFRNTGLDNHEPINVAFRKRKLPYRIRCDTKQTRPGLDYSKQCFKVSVMPK